jgi:hypothetical protein
VNRRLASGISLILFGIAICFFAAINANQHLLNAGIGSAVIGTVLMAFSSKKGLENLIAPYHEFLKRLADFMEIKKAVYIPPFEGFPYGAVFLAASEDFEIDLARLDFSSPFVSGREREAGIVLEAAGKEIVKKFEEFAELDLSGYGTGISEICSSVLRALGLARGVEIAEGGELKIEISDVSVDFCSGECRIIQCPICSSVLLAVAKAAGELIAVEELRTGEKIEIRARKLGGIEKWM